MDIQEIWDALRVRQASTPTSEQRSNAKLRLLKEPLRIYFPEKTREIPEISQPVSVSIRQAISGQTPWPLVWLGSAGLGKTCAALCLLDYAGGFYYTANDLGQEFIRSQQGRLFTKVSREIVHPERLWHEISTSNLVVLDELCSSSKVSDHQYECVKKLLDIREGKPLVVVSNVELDRIDKLYDERIASRLAGGTVLSLSGVDRRTAGKAPKLTDGTK